MMARMLSVTPRAAAVNAADVSSRTIQGECIAQDWELLAFAVKCDNFEPTQLLSALAKQIPANQAFDHSQ